MRIEDYLKFGVLMLIVIFIAHTVGWVGTTVVNEGISEKTPIQLVTELQNNYDGSQKTIEMKDEEITHLKEIIGKGTLEYIEELQKRPSGFTIGYLIFCFFLVGGMIGWMITDHYKEKKISKIRNKVWDKVWDYEYKVKELPKKYQKLFEGIEND